MVELKYSQKRAKEIAFAEKQAKYDANQAFSEALIAPFKGKYVEFEITSKNNHIKGAKPTDKVADDKATGLRLGIRELTTGADVFLFAPKEGLTSDWVLDTLGKPDAIEIGQHFVAKVISAKASGEKWGTVVQIDINKSQFAK